MLTLNNIAITRNYSELISNLSVTLFGGACLNLYGSNGCGKTTLLNKLASLTTIAKGTLLFNKVEVTKAIDEYRLLISYIGHKNSLTENFTVRENLEFWAGINNKIEAVEAALTCFNLQDISDSKVSELSAGQKRRAALARLLVSNSIIWLLDEPFANLDKKSEDLLKDVIKAKTQQNGIVIITSHTPIDDKGMLHIQLDELRNE
jgi:heme exporter protein A